MRLNLATRITIFRILLTIPFVACMLKINDARISQAMRDAARYASVVIFLVMAASDALDGYLARKNKQVTKLGTFLDPLADKLFLMNSFIWIYHLRNSLPVSNKLPLLVLIIVLSRDLIILLGVLILFLFKIEVKIELLNFP